MASGVNYTGLIAQDFAYYLDQGYVLRSRRNPAGTESEGELMIYRDDQPGQYLPLRFVASNRIVEPVGRVFIEVLRATAPTGTDVSALDRLQNHDVLALHGLSNEEVQLCRAFLPDENFSPRHGDPVEFAAGQYDFTLSSYADDLAQQAQNRSIVPTSDAIMATYCRFAKYAFYTGIFMTCGGLLVRQIPRLPIARQILTQFDMFDVSVGPLSLGERRCLFVSASVLAGIGVIEFFNLLRRL